MKKLKQQITIMDVARGAQDAAMVQARVDGAIVNPVRDGLDEMTSVLGPRPMITT